MEPEIARRCTKCGAAVRGQAKFCPQCRAKMAESLAAGQTTADTAAEPAAPPPPAAEKPMAGAINSTRTFTGEEHLALSDELARQRARVKAADEKNNATMLPNQQQKQDLQALAAQVRVELQAKKHKQGAQAERTQGEQERAQAQPQSEPVPARGARQREVTFMLLDEGQDDPTLRLVLIAIVLFVLFLLILLFSHILG